MEKEVIIDDDIKLKATSPESAAEEYALLIDSRDTILPWLKWLHSYDGLSPKEGVKARTEYQAEKLKQFEAGMPNTPAILVIGCRKSLPAKEL